MATEPAAPEGMGAAAVMKRAREAQSLEQLEQLCFRCEGCPFCSLCTYKIFGYGNEHAPIMFIQTNPSREEDECGEILVQDAGEIFDFLLESVGMSRQSNIYITQLVKCMPLFGRSPRKKESAFCINTFLKKQIELIAPKVIVTLGSLPTQTLILGRTNLEDMCGRWYKIGDTWFFPTYHPASFLRGKMVYFRNIGLEHFRIFRAKLDELGIDPNA